MPKEIIVGFQHLLSRYLKMEMRTNGNIWFLCQVFNLLLSDIIEITFFKFKCSLLLDIFLETTTTIQPSVDQVF